MCLSAIDLLVPVSSFGWLVLMISSENIHFSVLKYADEAEKGRNKWHQKLMYMSDEALRVIEYVPCLFVRYCTNKLFPTFKNLKAMCDQYYPLMAMHRRKTN